MLTITVRFTVKPGYEERFLQRVQAQARATLDREPNCRQFDVCRHERDRRAIFLYERYTDESAFADHLRTAHFLAFDAETRDWIEDKRVERWHLM